MRIVHLAIGAPIGLALIAGCTRNVPTVAAQRPVPVVAAKPAPAALSPAQYMATAASIDLFEIRSSELALRRSAEARHRQFAAMMVTAHLGTGAQLSFAGRRLNLLPPASLLPKHQAMISDLERSERFDTAYRRAQIAVHQEAIGLHDAFARRGSSATLRPVARAAVPILRRHLALLHSTE